MKGLKTIAFLISYFSLVACGGGGGESVQTVGSDTQENETLNAINGVVSKGIVAGALVHAIPDSDLNTGIIATTTTNDDGSFSLEIPDAFLNQPILLVVRSKEGARMKCDLLAGCDLDGDAVTIDDLYDFSEWMPLQPSFQMMAVTTTVADTLQTNITPLTHLAASLIVNREFADQEALKSAIAQANAQVADLFGFAGNITSIPVADATDINSFENISGNLDWAVRYAAINSGIVAAVLSDDIGSGQNLRIDQVLWKVGDYYDRYGLPKKALSNEVTDLAEIMSEAQLVAKNLNTQLLEENLLSNHSLLFAVSDAYSDLGFDASLYAQAEPSDTGGRGVVIDDDGRSNYEKVKGFVEEIRELGVAIDSSVVQDSLGNNIDTVGNMLNGFQQQMDAAEMVSSRDAEFAYKALSRSLEAILKIYESDNPDLSEVTIDRGMYQILGDNYVDSVIVRVDIDEQGIRAFVVDGPVTVTKNGETREVDVDLALTLNALRLVEGVQKSDDVTILDDETKRPDYVNNEIYEGHIDLYLSGVVTSGSVRLDINNGIAKALYTGVVRDEVQAWELYDGSTYESLLLRQSYWTIDQLLIDLDASVEQIVSSQIPNPIKFEGAVRLAIDDLVVTEERSNGFLEDAESGYDIYSNYLWVNEFSDFTFSISGSASNQVGESFLLDLNLSLDDSKVSDWAFLLDKCSKYICGLDQDVFFDINGSEEEHLGIAASLRFSAELAGVSDVLVVDFDFNAYDQYMANVDLTLMYPGRVIEVSGMIDYDYLLYSYYYDETIYVGELFIQNMNDGVQAKFNIDTAIDFEGDEETMEIEMRMDTNLDGKIDDKDFLYGWYEERNGLDLLIFQDDLNPGVQEFQSLF